MRSAVPLVLVLMVSGCASRPTPISPYVPPEAMYSTGGTMAAMGGVLGTAVGSSMMEKDRSPNTRKAGAAVTGGGAALLGAAILEAIEVEKEREKLFALYHAFLRRYYGTPAPEAPFRE